MKISPYQTEGAFFLAQNHLALLADDMGLGKTAQAIMAADTVNAKKILIICPAVARVNWRREFAEWSIFSQEFTICESFKDKPTERTIVSYEYATENSEILKVMEWDLVICDESHFIKEPTAKRTVSIYGKNGIIRNAKRLWGLSGTPAPNHIGELWPMLLTFNATKLSYEKFIEEFCKTRPTFYGGQRKEKVVGTRKDKIPEIKEMLSGVMLRRMKKDVLKDLPPKAFFQVSVEGTPLMDVLLLEKMKVEKQEKLVKKSIFDATEDEMAFILEKLGNSVSSLRRYVGLQKVKSCAEFITQELNDGAYEKIVIFAIHTEVIAQLKDLLKAFNPVVINGSVSAPMRQGSIDSFQKNPETKVFIGNIKAAGTAITLTAAHHCLFVEQSWVPGENAQAADRVHRRGQEMPVTIRFASLADSIDEKVTSVLKRKTEELSQIFDA